MTETETKVPSDEKTEGEQPRLEYDILPSTREEPESNFTAAGQRYSAVAASAQAGGQLVAAEAPPDQAQPAETEKKSVVSRLSKLAANQTRVYAVVGIGFGLLVGFAIAIYFIHSGAQDASTDLGSVSAPVYGLKGHLTAKWADNRLAYHLNIEPSAPEHRAAFIAAVSNSPRPLFIDIQLKDPFGAVLCGNSILLKYDPRNAVPVAASEPEPGSRKKARKPDESAEIKKQLAQTASLAQMQIQEIDREHGNDLFQNNLGPDGNLASISAEGIMPCSKKQFDGTATWGLTSNFPVVAPPPDAPGTNGAPQASQDPAGNPSENSKAWEAARRRRRSRPEGSPVSIEGDDQIIWFDASTGVAETRAGKALLIDKTDAVANALKSRDFPITIHYRCDETGACTFAGVGNLVEHARLKR